MNQPELCQRRKGKCMFEHEHEWPGTAPLIELSQPLNPWDVHIRCSISFVVFSVRQNGLIWNPSVPWTEAPSIGHLSIAGDQDLLRATGSGLAQWIMCSITGIKPLNTDAVSSSKSDQDKKFRRADIYYVKKAELKHKLPRAASWLKIGVTIRCQSSGKRQLRGAL